MLPALWMPDRSGEPCSCFCNCYVLHMLKSKRRLCIHLLLKLHSHQGQRSYLLAQLMPEAAVLLRQDSVQRAVAIDPVQCSDGQPLPGLLDIGDLVLCSQKHHNILVPIFGVRHDHLATSKKLNVCIHSSAASTLAC